MHYRSLVRLATAESLPVSLDDFKAHARVDGTSDDAYATSLIALAADFVEDSARRTILHTRYEMRIDKFPPWGLPLPRPPMATAPGTLEVEVEYLNENGTTVVLPAEQYRVSRSETPGHLYPLWNGSWPVGFRDQEGVIAVRWWAGYGESSSAVPRQIRHLILMLANHWYANREAVSASPGVTVPVGADALMSHISWGQYG